MRRKSRRFKQGGSGMNWTAIIVTAIICTTLVIVCRMTGGKKK
jgi:hypothetical protein